PGPEGEEQVTIGDDSEHFSFFIHYGKNPAVAAPEQGRSLSQICSRCAVDRRSCHCISDFHKPPLPLLGWLEACFRPSAGQSYGFKTQAPEGRQSNSNCITCTAPIPQGDHRVAPGQLCLFLRIAASLSRLLSAVACVTPMGDPGHGLPLRHGVRKKCGGTREAATGRPCDFTHYCHPESGEARAPERWDRTARGPARAGFLLPSRKTGASMGNQ